MTTSYINTSGPQINVNNLNKTLLFKNKKKLCLRALAVSKMQLGVCLHSLYRRQIVCRETIRYALMIETNVYTVQYTRQIY